MLTETTTDNGMRIWHSQPATETPLPLVLLLHERYGPVEHTFNVLERFAEAGFIAATPDLFHRFPGERGPIERAEERIDTIDSEAVTDIDATLDYLRSLSYVDGGQVGVAGFCLSGRTPLVYAVARPEQVAAISIAHGGIYPRDYHGDKPGQASVADLIPQIHCPILGMFGEADRSVPMENISRFRSDLERNKLNYWIQVFGDTPHGWMNTTEPERYRELQSDLAWNTLKKFYSSVFSSHWSKDSLTWRFESDVNMKYNFSV